MSKWNIIINDFLGGLSPLFADESYPAYGNKNMAGAMVDISLFNPNYLEQGRSDSQLTNGGLSGAVTNLIAGISPQVDYLGNAYGVGGAKFYQFSNDAMEVTSNGTWPHTIDKSAVSAEAAHSTITYGTNTYYVYNHSGPAAEIGKHSPPTTFDDDWGSTVPSGAAALYCNDTLTTYHPLCVGGNDVLYIGNAAASTVGSYDGTTLIPSAIDLPTLSDITSLAWQNDRLYIFANNPRLFGSGYRYRSSIYIWDGTTNSWEAEIPVNGRVGGSHVFNGTLFFFYRHYGYGPYKLAYVNGSQIVDLCAFDSSGAPPTQEEITDAIGFLIWNAYVNTGDKLYAYGSVHSDFPARLFQFGSSLYTNIGAVASPTGYLHVSSTNNTNYRIGTIDLSRSSSDAYQTSGSYKTLLFNVSGETGLSRLNSLVFNFEKLESGARVDWSMVNNQGRTIYSDTISYAKLGAVTQCVYELNGLLAENFRIELSYANGSTTKTVKIKNIKVYGNSNQ